MVDRQLELLARHDSAPAVDGRAEAGTVVVGEERHVVLRHGLDGGPRRIRLHARSVERKEDVGDPAQLLDEIGSSAGASSVWRRSVGRIPRITSPAPGSTATSGASGSSIPAKATRPSATVASTTFMDGEPMNAATKRFPGSWKRRCGVSHC